MSVAPLRFFLETIHFLFTRDNSYNKNILNFLPRTRRSASRSICIFIAFIWWRRPTTAPTGQWMDAARGESPAGPDETDETTEDGGEGKNPRHTLRHHASNSR